MGPCTLLGRTRGPALCTLFVMDRYGVMGNPIAHSRSPLIHRMFAEQTGQAMSYAAILVNLDEFARAVEAFEQADGKGLNVTVPFKEDAWQLMNVCTPRAQEAQAVNTVWFSGSERHGDNTDGVGLVRDLTRNWDIPIAGQRILLVGAGGAARGTLGALLEQDPALLTIANRTPERAGALARQFSGRGRVDACGFHKLQGRRFDLIVNATSASLQHRVPALPEGLLTPGGCCYDMVYGDAPTSFVRWGETQGASKSVDGLGMLVEQAAESFLHWRGVRPETGPVVAALRRRPANADS